MESINIITGVFNAKIAMVVGERIVLGASGVGKPTAYIVMQQVRKNVVIALGKVKNDVFNV